jgi:hypothetical protein
MSVTIVSPTVILVKNKHIDVTRCRQSHVVRIFKIINETFTDTKAKHIGKQVALLQSLNDLGELDHEDREYLRKHILKFMELWWLGAKSQRVLGDFEVDTILKGTSGADDEVTKMQGSYVNVTGIDHSKKLIIDKNGGLKLVPANSSGDEAGNVSVPGSSVEDIDRRIAALRAAIRACVTSSDGTKAEAQACVNNTRA